MSLADRRGMIRLAVGAALAPVIMSRSALGATVSSRAITPPDRPMIYVRALERELAGGFRLTVRRMFNVHFERQGRGFRLVGNQTSAAVDFPENLASLARLEEQRVETGYFPMLLDQTGQIVSGPETARSHEVELAIEEARRRLGNLETDPTDMDEAQQLVESIRLAGTSVVSRLPGDLFAPHDTSRSEEGQISLPWGEAGRVRMDFSAERDPQTGLMRMAQRVVTTTIAEDARRSIESFELTPA